MHQILKVMFWILKSNFVIIVFLISLEVRRLTMDIFIVYEVIIMKLNHQFFMTFNNNMRMFVEKTRRCMWISQRFTQHFFAHKLSGSLKFINNFQSFLCFDSRNNIQLSMCEYQAWKVKSNSCKRLLLTFTHFHCKTE